MKTLSDFKRRLIPGLPVTVEFPGSVIRGNLGNTVIPSRTVTRRVHSVRPSGVTWESEAKPGTPGSRLDWPRADCVTFPDANTAAIAHTAGGSPFAVYRFTA